MEYVFNDKNYNCRVFFDAQNQPLSFYFDINNGTGKDKDGVWYDDLYLDVILECPIITGGFYYVKLDDEKEFKQARKDGLVDDELFAKGYAIARSLMEELRDNKNEIVKRCSFDLCRIKQKLKIT